VVAGLFQQQHNPVESVLVAAAGVDRLVLVQQGAQH
jgi:hypothetical protein